MIQEKIDSRTGSLTALRGQFQGEIIRPGDPGYDQARAVWNGLIDRYPAAIARCTSTEDVIAAVNFARDNDLPLAVRGSGHNVAGTAVADGGLVIDLSLMKDIRLDLDRGTVTAQPGVVFGELDRATQPYGLAVPAGIVSETGIPGLTLGGGFGWLTPKYGFTCDSLVSAEVVTADGRRLVASAAENPDLFWAIRGGGGNFGVATALEYRLRPVGPDVLAGMVIHRLDAAADVLRFYREFIARAPRDLGAMAAFLTAPAVPFIPAELHGKPVLAIIVCYAGDAAEGERVLRPLREFGSPVFDGVKVKPFAEHNSSLDAGQPRGRHYYWKSEYLTEIADGAIETLVAYAAEMTSPHSRLAVFRLGGAIKDQDEQAMAMGNRHAEFILAINSGWVDAGDNEKEIRWTRDLWTAMRPFAAGGVYVNFLSADDGEDRVRAAYGPDKYRRLAQIKARYDPGNLFRTNKNIQPLKS